MNTERVEAGPYKAELIDGLWMVTGPNGWKSHNGDCRDRFDSDMVAKRMNYAHTAALAALRAELDAANIKANAWDELWSACEQWGDATAHRELEGKGRTVESLLDYAKQNKELRAEVERAKTVIENYELDYDRVVVRGEKCAMELAVAEAATLRAEVERLKAVETILDPKRAADIAAVVKNCRELGWSDSLLAAALNRVTDANAELTQLREDRRAQG